MILCGGKGAVQSGLFCANIGTEHTRHRRRERKSIREEYGTAALQITMSRRLRSGCLRSTNTREGRQSATLKIVIYSGEMKEFAKTCEAIGSTSKKLEKTAILADYLKSCPVDEAAVSAVFLSGQPFPVFEETTLQVGGRSLWSIVAELTGKDESELSASYRRLGDLGAVAGDVLPDRPEQGRLRVLELEAAFRQIAAARGAAARTVIVRDLLSRATPL